MGPCKTYEECEKPAWSKNSVEKPVLRSVQLRYRLPFGEESAAHTSAWLVQFAKGFSSSHLSLSDRKRPKLFVYSLEPFVNHRDISDHLVRIWLCVVHI